ncbi:MAG: family 1 glycosylhydrolase [Acetobacteraceae bacterium]|nr:family 1 glycosylhydrolase [Acetobacteraceae bacterium]
MMPGFLFATGVENSIPMVGSRRVDQMAASNHYARWRDDFDATEELGLQALRYGVPLHTAWRGHGRCDWSFADETFGDLSRRNLHVIADLCHFGLPDWLGDFQNPDFPELFAHYARAFAQRFPWVRFYTPVNEMFICARFSGHFGWWNERLKTDRGFVTALKHLVRANRLAMDAILDVRPDALFIQSESMEQFHPEEDGAHSHAEHLNRIRFLSLDLNYGRPVCDDMRAYLLESGMTRAELGFFERPGPARRHCIMGADYYVTNEHHVRADGMTGASGDLHGYAAVTRQYHDRYGLPIMHTETNLNDWHGNGAAIAWLHKQWTDLLHLRETGVPVLGFTWYSITDQVDWDTALREANGRVNPLGLYDLDRNIRPVGRAFQRLARDWSRILMPAGALQAA